MTDNQVWAIYMGTQTVEDFMRLSGQPTTETAVECYMQSINNGEIFGHIEMSGGERAAIHIALVAKIMESQP